MKNNQDIIIFGGNSVLAQNFRKNCNSDLVNFINISRSTKVSKDIFCDIGMYMNKEKLEILKKEINSKLIYNSSIFILFSWSGGPRTKNKLEDTWSINKNIILNFLSICKYLKPSKIVFISSAGTLYPTNKETYKFNEKDLISPKLDYGKQKFIAEKTISNYALDNNLDYLILRVSSAYGYDNRFSDQGVINKWLYSAVQDKTLKLYNSENSVINFISFKQISEAIRILLKNDKNGIYNIGTESSISLKDIIEKVCKITNKKLDVEIINNENRFFNIDISKFYFDTGIKFPNELEKDMKYIYEAILGNEKDYF